MSASNWLRMKNSGFNGHFSLWGPIIHILLIVIWARMCISIKHTSQASHGGLITRNGTTAALERVRLSSRVPCICYFIPRTGGPGGTPPDHIVSCNETWNISNYRSTKCTIAESMNNREIKPKESLFTGWIEKEKITKNNFLKRKKSARFTGYF